MGKQKKSNTEALEYNSQGNEYYEDGNYEKAKELYHKALEIDSKLPEAYYNLGLVAKKLKNIDTAISQFNDAIEHNPEYVQAMNQLGICYYESNDYNKAEEFYFKALEINEKLDYIYYNLALVERERGNQEKRKEYLEKSIKISPNYSSALNELGNYFYDSHEYEDAELYYRRAFRADSLNKYAIYNLGLIAEVNCDFEEAKSYYNKSLKIDPDYDLALKSLSDIEDRINEEEELYGENDSSKVEVPEKTLFVEKIGRNLNDLAADGKLIDVIGREKEIDTIFEILYKRFKNNPILIGYPGVGKTALVEGIAQKIVKKKVPDYFKDKEIIELNIGFIIAGTKYRGDFEVKIKKIINDARENDNIILFIDEIHTIIGAGRVEDSNLDIAQMMKPALQSGEITIIGATTRTDYRKYIEKDPAFERRFYPVSIEELSPDDTKKILYHNLKKANKYYKINYTKKNIDEIVELSEKYLKKRYFPDKAIDIFEKIASRVSLKGRQKISSTDIKGIVGETAGISFVEDDTNEMNRMIDMEKELKKQIYGQDEGVDSVCNLLRISRRRLDLRPEQPDGVFLFTGPTGVGKTYMAKCLCDFLFGDDKRLIQLDMSEYSEPHSVAKIVGAPPGYVGYNDVSSITGLIEDNPVSILLLDEIEKAHINVIKLFLQVFEEGKITDSKGKKVYFSDVTVIMTSNILAKEKQSLGFLLEKSNSQKIEGVVAELSKFFSREFLNRIDEIIIFNPLTEKDIENILTQVVFTITKKRFREEKIDLDFHKSIVKQVISEGYSQELGARNLQRTFEKIILSPLVKYIYKKNCKNVKLRLEFKDDVLIIDEVKKKKS